MNSVDTVASISKAWSFNSVVCVVCCFAFFGTIPASAQETATTSCVIGHLNEIEIPALRDGQISKLTINRGHRISKDQQIAQLDPINDQLRLEVANAELSQAKDKANDEANVLTARTRVERAAQEHKLIGELGNSAVFLEKFRVANDLTRSKSELLAATNQHRQDELAVRVKQNKSRIIENDIKQLVVNSPVDGIVKELKRDQGEWVRQGEPIAVVTRMDRLVAEGFLDYTKVPIHRILGAKATLQLELNPGELISVESLEIRHATPELELDEKYPVWVEFDNRLIENQHRKTHWQFRPGMQATLIIQLGK